MNALARTRYEVPATVILHRTSSQKELAQCLTSLRDHADGIVLSLGTEHDHSLKDSVQNLRSQGIPTILLQIGANKERSSLASLCSGEILAADVRGYVRGVQMAIEHATRVHN
jgi:methylmalonyl-CoA mutase cobalamin-binding subunit